VVILNQIATELDPLASVSMIFVDIMVETKPQAIELLKA
jgi:hypothetical protein